MLDGWGRKLERVFSIIEQISKNMYLLGAKKSIFDFSFLFLVSPSSQTFNTLLEGGLQDLQEQGLGTWTLHA